MEKLLAHPAFQPVLAEKEKQKFSFATLSTYDQLLRFRERNRLRQLLDHIYLADVFLSVAKTGRERGYAFPQAVARERQTLTLENFWHPSLEKPVKNSLEITPEGNVLFLTGANMAGKSTLIKALGSSVFLAHIGMGVPAQSMKLTLFDGLLSNINVVDNIAKGESFFFNEVQRIKNTIEKINTGKKWLVLIDELFKGTNVQDAMKCSIAVIKGLIKIKNSLFILSTHLYEIGEELKKYPNISFRYFETNVKDDQLEFTYQLKEGISNDRIGYVILKREKVVDMLNNL